MTATALRKAAFMMFGILLGIGGMTFQYAEGLSYLSPDPAACIHCHIMRPQYDGWQKASHHIAAGCADCHLPAGFPENYIVKAENGWNHSKAFTLQNFHEPIFITPKNADVLQNNCLRCHADLVSAQSYSHAEGAPRCARCHGTVGHGETAGLGGPMRTLSENSTEEMEE